MTEGSPQAVLRSNLALLRDAAVQRRFMRAWLRDSDFKEADGKILYAVDMDVIRMYAHPKEQVLADRVTDDASGLAYGRMFWSDGDDIAEVLSMRLVDFIFFRLAGDLPLLVVPPIHEELDGYISSLVRNHGDTPRPRTLDVGAINKLLVELQAPPDEEHREALQKALNRVHELVHFDRSQEGAFRRIHQLLQSGRVAGPEAPDLLSRLEDEPFARALSPFSEFDRVVRHYDATNGWIERLRKVGHAGRTARRDAAALGRIEVWNAELARSNRKIVYITGSRSVFHAGWDYRLPGHMPSDESSRFADLYLRHPRAFVDEPGVLETTESQPANDDIGVLVDTDSVPTGGGALFGLLQTFVPKIPSHDVLDTKYHFELSADARELARKTFEQQPDLCTNLQQKWAEFTRAIRPGYRVPETIEERLIEMYSDVAGASTALDRLRGLEDNLTGLIEDAARETWTHCFEMALRAGTFFELNSYVVPPRSVPPLLFDNWRSTHAFVELIAGWHSSVQVDVAAYDREIDAVDADDPSGYAHYLVHSALFAGWGRWDVAALLAAKSLALSQPHKRVPGRPNGREAAYFLCVCRRHAAKTIEDLDGLDAIIDQAIAIMEEEQETRKIEVIPERFHGEKLALQHTRLMFVRFPTGERKLPEAQIAAWKASRDALAGSFDHLTVQIGARIEAVQQKLQNPDPEIAMNASRHMATLLKIHVRALTNIISLLLIDGHPDQLAANPMFRKAGENLLKYHPRAEEGPEISFFVKTVTECAGVILAKSPSSRRMLRRDLLKQLSAQQIADNRVLPYDADRFLHFRSMIER